MEDRLSNLPDEVLTHILAFLPIEEAVRTGILSKRWIDVWTSLQILVFDDDHEHLGEDLTDDDFLQREFKFQSFVHHVLFRRKTSPLDTFKLTWFSKFTVAYPYISKLLSFAVLCMPRVLSVNISTNEPFFLPDSIFTCPSVEEMSINLLAFNDDDDFIGAESIKLPCLKKLELHSMMINDDFMRILLPGCPILEELVFCTCQLEIEEISSTVLKKLTFELCEQYGTIQISCPGVVSLDIGLSDSEGIILKNTPSLVTAELLFVSTCNNLSHDLKLLHGLSNVARLSLNTSYLMDLLATYPQNFPIFNNLKSLDLTVLDMDFHLSLVVFLRHSNNLETLNLSFCQKAREVATKEELLGDVPFQLEYLERLNIICYKTNAKFSEEAIHRLSGFIRSIGEVIVDLR